MSGWEIHASHKPSRGAAFSANSVRDVSTSSFVLAWKRFPTLWALPLVGRLALSPFLLSRVEICSMTPSKCVCRRWKEAKPLLILPSGAGDVVSGRASICREPSISVASRSVSFPVLGHFIDIERPSMVGSKTVCRRRDRFDRNG